MKKTITVIINTKSNEEFKPFIGEDTILNDNLQEKPVVILTREDGTTKQIALSTFKRYYKEISKEIEVEEPKAETKPLTRHQEVAAKQLKYAYNWVVGGHENDLTDNDTPMPLVEELFEEVMFEATSHLYGEGYCSSRPAPVAMNFAGKQFLLETLASMFEADGYEVPESCKKLPEKRKATGPRKNVKGDPESVGEDEVVMRAFTGMLIGVFKIVEQTKEVISVELANGCHMDFDAKTGIEICARNARYANHIEI